jgi:hypothetical protein
LSFRSKSATNSRAEPSLKTFGSGPDKALLGIADFDNSLFKTIQLEQKQTQDLFEGLRLANEAVCKAIIE